MSNIFKGVSESIEIMVVDDVLENIRILARILKRKGFQVTSAVSGEAALELIKRSKPNLVLLDIRMPGLSGLDTCKKIKSNLDTQDLPIIFISGMDDIDSKTKGFEAGGVDYISKPFLPEEVILRVNNALRAYFCQKEQEEKNKKLEDLIAETNVATWEWNFKKGEGISNESFAELLGYSKEEMKILNYESLLKMVHIDDSKLLTWQLEKLSSKGIEYLEIEIRLKHNNGHWVWVNSKVKVLQWDADGLPMILNGSISDISKIKYAELGFSQMEEGYLTLREQMRSFIWEVDVKGLYTYVDHICSSIIGYLPDELIGKKHFFDLFLPNEGQEFTQRVFSVFNVKKPFEDFENKILTKDGRTIWVSTNAIPVLDDQGNLSGYRGNDMDITIRKEKENEILFLSYHDQLTGLYNRRFFEEELIIQDTENNLPLTIIIGDVNGLKLINDSFGHAVGDELLKKTAISLEKISRKEDIIARWGGDEFVAILPRTDAAEAERLTSRINELSLNEKVNGVNLSISFGSATKTIAKEEIRGIIKNAEDELYRNKLYGSSGMRSDTVQLIINTLYEKNHREMLHSKRVSLICEAIAFQLNYTKNEISKMKIAGMVHDIGKIGINENILNKPSKLSDSEWNEMKNHSEIGFRILSSVNEFHEVAAYVLEHHEKWGGTGYPRGLKGKEISMQARIIAVADAYDAMTSIRSYGTQLSKTEAENELKRCSGVHFDPEIVDVFINKVMNTLSFKRDCLFF